MEVTEPLCLPTQLATRMGMYLGPSNVDLIITYLSSSYKHFHELPLNQLMAIDHVMATFKEATTKYQAKHDHMPSVFIDRVDLLTKHDPELFLWLISHANIFANQLIARFVFISSEGSIMPILKSTSAMNRLTN